MDPCAIEIARENAIFSLGMSLKASAGKLNRDAYLLAQIAARYHILGVVSLLADSDRSGFIRHLALSGQVECDLRRLDLSADPTHNAASRFVPFVDALAAGDLESARTIAQLAPDAHQDGYEYEDDFLRYRFMHRLLLAPDDGPALNRILDRWNVVAEGDPTEYHTLSRAILARNDDAFDGAIHAVLARRRNKLAEWRKTPDYRVEIDAVEGGLFILGLAYLRLAELRGIRTRDNYEDMPSLARVPLGAAFPPPGRWRTGAA